MSQINIILETYSVIISGLLILCLVVCRDYKTKLGRIFFAMLAMNFLVLVNDIITWVFDRNPKYNILMMAVNFFVYTFSYVFVALFTKYLTTCIEQKKTLLHTKIFLYVVYGTCTIALILLF